MEVQAPPSGGEELRAELTAADINDPADSAPADIESGEKRDDKRAHRSRRKQRHRAVPLGREVRFFAPTNVELRREAHDDTDEIIIRGAPVVYGRSYTVHDMFGEFSETIHPGALRSLLDNGVDCRLLLNHDGMPMARTASGTMKLWDTPDALMFEARLDARSQLSNDFAVAIERGDLSQMSIGMIVGRDDWGHDGQVETRDIFELNDLLDVSGVTYPCSPTTHLEVAQRMAFAMPIETRARLRQMEVDLRAGKVLSADSQSKLVAALSALHDLASAGGIDPAEIGPNADDEGEGAPEHADGSDDDPRRAEAGAAIAYPDGSGGRKADDSNVETREEPARMKTSTLRLLVEAGRGLPG